MPTNRLLVSGAGLAQSDEFELFLRTTTLGDALNELPRGDCGGDVLREAANTRGNGGPLSLQLPLSVALGYVPQSQLWEVINSLYCLMLRR